MIREIRLRRAHIDLVSPFRTSFGVETARELLYLEVIGDGGTGWGDAAPDTFGSKLTFALTRGGSANEYKLDISQGLATFSTGSAFYSTGAGSGATSIDEVEIYTISQGADQNVGFNNLEIIPEPSSASLIGLGLAGLVALRKTRKA
ncbi:MAG: PEP-CTERM sorting domain-containing protein [Acidimicrobiia bacterium]|nr:PEP-CTERM sorting domain-containing protein [Acidimicrobiia bacterium]